MNTIDSSVREELMDRGCLYLGEQRQFIGISGKHLTGYCNIDPAATDSRFMSRVGLELVEPYANDEVEAVLVPAIGAIPLSQWGPHHLMEMNPSKFVAGAWADKVDPPEGSTASTAFAIERNGFEKAVAGKRVLILEDMINQMFSAGELVRIAREIDCEVVGVAAIAANSGVSAEALKVPNFNKLCDVIYDAFTEEDCLDHGPCSEGWPIVADESLGHGGKLLKEGKFPRSQFIRLLDD